MRFLNLIGSLGALIQALYRKKPKTFTGVVLLFVGLAINSFLPPHWMHHFLSSIEWLEIEKVSVNSQWPLKQQSIGDQLVHLKGKSLLTLDVNLELKKLRQEKWIDSIYFKKDFPNHLIVEIKTKKPYAIEHESHSFFFIDEIGKRISQATVAQLAEVDLPFVTLPQKSVESGWSRPLVGELVHSMGSKRFFRYEVSELHFDNYPFFKVYLSAPQLEIVLSHKNWESQFPYLDRLVRNPPTIIEKMRRVRMVVHKKAVVSTQESN